MFTIPTDTQKNKVKKYTIMHEDTPVLEFNRETDEVNVYNAALLSFGLNNKPQISAVAVLEWLTNRVDNLSRTYMNMVYIARRVGGDRDKIIKDSSGVSFTDNYWIKTRDSIADWNELKTYFDTDDVCFNTRT